MSKSLIQLVDYSIVPAILLFFGKIVGVIGLSRLFGTPLTFKEYSDSILRIAPVVSDNDLMVLTSYSDLIMYGVVAGYMTLVLMRAVFFHSTHVKPTLSVALAQKNLLSLIQNSYQIYHAAAIALIFLWFTNVLIIINIIAGNTFMWTGIVTVISSLFLTTVLLQDVYREVENIRRKPGQYQWQ